MLFSKLLEVTRQSQFIELWFGPLQSLRASVDHGTDVFFAACHFKASIPADGRIFSCPYICCLSICNKHSCSTYLLLPVFFAASIPAARILHCLYFYSKRSCSTYFHASQTVLDSTTVGAIPTCGVFTDYRLCARRFNGLAHFCSEHSQKGKIC